MIEKKGLVVFVEGDTDVEFYQALLLFLKERSPSGRYPFDVVLPPKNMRGIGSFKERAVRKFEKQVLRDNKGTRFTVVLAYDTDVFEFADKPPINWKEVENALKKAGAEQVIHLRARRSIEDWFLLDEAGVKRYLHISPTVCLKGATGLKRLESAFKKANRVYVKGNKVKGFVGALDIKLIAGNLCEELSPLCSVLRITCDQNGMCESRK